MPGLWLKSRAQDAIKALSPFFWFDPSLLQGLGAGQKILMPVDITGNNQLRPMAGFAQANTPYTVPSSKNGKCTLRFNGASHIGGYQFPSKTLTAYTAFQVVKPLTMTGNYYATMLGSSASGTAYINLTDFSGGGTFVSQVSTNGVSSTGSAYATSPSGVSINNWFIARTVFDGTTLTVYKNGVAGTPVSAAGKIVIVDQFGIYSSVTYLNNSEFGDSLLWTSALSVANQNAVESALNAKWGVY